MKKKTWTTQKGETEWSEKEAEMTGHHILQ